MCSSQGVTTTTILRDSVPYRIVVLNILEDAVKWAFGFENLFAPLRPSDDFLHTSIILLKLNLITIRILVRVLIQQNVAVIMIMQLVIRMQLVQYSLQAYFACH